MSLISDLTQGAAKPSSPHMPHVNVFWIGGPCYQSCAQRRKRSTPCPTACACFRYLFWWVEWKHLNFLLCWKCLSSFQSTTSHFIIHVKSLTLVLYKIKHSFDYLDLLKFWFRPSHSTVTALLTLINDIYWERDGGSASLLVLFDLLVKEILLIIISFWSISRRWTLVVLLLPAGPFLESSHGKQMFSTMWVVLWCPTEFHLVPHSILHLYEAPGSCHQQIWSEVSSIW